MKGLIPFIIGMIVSLAIIAVITGVRSESNDLLQPVPKPFSTLPNHSLVESNLSTVDTALISLTINPIELGNISNSMLENSIAKVLTIEDRILLEKAKDSLFNVIKQQQLKKRKALEIKYGISLVDKIYNDVQYNNTNTQMNSYNKRVVDHLFEYSYSIPQ